MAPPEAGAVLDVADACVNELGCLFMGWRKPGLAEVAGLADREGWPR